MVCVRVVRGSLHIVVGCGFCQAEDGRRPAASFRRLGNVYKRQGRRRGDGQLELEVPDDPTYPAPSEAVPRESASFNAGLAGTNTIFV